MKKNKNYSITKISIPKICLAVLTFVGFSFLLDIWVKFSTEYYINALKDYINITINNDPYGNYIGLEVINLEADFGFKLFFFPITILHDILSNFANKTTIATFSTYIWIIIIIWLSLSCLNLKFLHDGYYEKTNKYKKYNQLAKIIWFIFTVLSLTFLIVCKIPNYSTKNFLSMLIDEHKIKMIVEYNELYFLEKRQRTANFNSKNSIISTDFGQRFYITHENSLSCEITNFVMSKKGLIENSIIDNMTSTNEKITANISNKNNEYKIDININSKKLIFNNIYLKAKEDKIYFSDINTDKSDLFLKCQDGYYSLYFRDIMIMKNNVIYKIDNLIKYLDENIKES